jgi:hypothetical protein
MSGQARATEEKAKATLDLQRSILSIPGAEAEPMLNACVNIIVGIISQPRSDVDLDEFLEHVRSMARAHAAGYPNGIVPASESLKS